MASKRVSSILKHKSAPFSEEEIEAMSDARGWSWIYAQAQRERNARDTREQICFTGQKKDEKGALGDAAADAGFRVVKSVTSGLDYLCIGIRAGASKIRKAESQDTKIISTEEFLEILDKHFSDMGEADAE